MSDNNFPCGKCGGSGETDARFMGANGWVFKTNPCPSCSKGRIQLAVPCERCLDGWVHEAPHAMDGFTSSTVPCPKKCTNGYRPLTDSEVRELINNLKPTGTTQYDPVELMMGNIERGEQELKGLQVVLIPTTN